MIIKNAINSITVCGYQRELIIICICTDNMQKLETNKFSRLVVYSGPTDIHICKKMYVCLS